MERLLKTLMFDQAAFEDFESSAEVVAFGIIVVFLSGALAGVGAVFTPAVSEHTLHTSVLHPPNGRNSLCDVVCMGRPQLSHRHQGLEGRGLLQAALQESGLRLHTGAPLLLARRSRRAGCDADNPPVDGRHRHGSGHQRGEVRLRKSNRNDRAILDHMDCGSGKRTAGSENSSLKR